MAPSSCGTTLRGTVNLPTGGRAETGSYPLALRGDAQFGDLLGSGAAGPSTGYAFQRIQRWADDCAAALAAGRFPVGHQHDPFLLRGMDALFLSVLRARSTEAQAMFFSLFSKVKPERMIRFLSDKGTLADYLCVVSALPVLPFLREIPGALRHAV